MSKLRIELEYSSLFRQSKYLESIKLSGSRIRKKDFFKKFNIFLKLLNEKY